LNVSFNEYPDLGRWTLHGYATWGSPTCVHKLCEKSRLLKTTT